MGRFGTLLFNIIKKNFPEALLVEKIEEADVIFPCVPIRAFEAVIKEIAPKLKSGALVIDVCSVKVHPVKVMLKHLPENIDIVASHPLFGPDSARDGLKNLPLVLWPVRIDRKKFNKIVKTAKKFGLSVHIMSPEEHDRITAFSQLYTHLIGRIGQELKIKRSPIDTLGFKRLFSVQDQVTNDTEELFFDMNRFNTFAPKMRKKVLVALVEVEKMLAADYNGRRIYGH